MGFRLGNMSIEWFISQTGAEFTEAELARLREVHSNPAKLTGPDQFHIFEGPFVVTVGSMEGEALSIFRAANSRKPFTPAVMFSVDDEWKAKS